MSELHPPQPLVFSLLSFTPRSPPAVHAQVQLTMQQLSRREVVAEATVEGAATGVVAATPSVPTGRAAGVAGGHSLPES